MKYKRDIHNPHQSKACHVFNGEERQKRLLCSVNRTDYTKYTIQFLQASYVYIMQCNGNYVVQSNLFISN